MRRMIMIACILALPLASACSQDNAANNAEARRITQTRMDDIDKIEGTISDEMIDTTQSTDEAALSDTAGTDPKDALPKTTPPKTGREDRRDDTTPREGEKAKTAPAGTE